MPRRFLGFVACALLGVLAFATAASATPRAAGDAVTDAQERVEVTQFAANIVAARYGMAVGRQAQLAGDIGALEARLPGLEAKAATLREQVARRAAALYVHDESQDQFAALDGTEQAMQSGRRTEFVDAVNSANLDAVAQLRRTESRVKRQRAQLVSDKAEQEQLMAQLNQEQRDLDAALKKANAALQAAQRVTALSATAMVPIEGKVCPVAGAMSFRDNFGEPRFTGTPHPHGGIDMMAVRGTPAVAIMAGNVWRQSDPLGGMSVYLDADDGNTYYYTHLDSYEGAPGHVEQGQIVGRVGSSGDADGGAPHLHFESRLGGANGTKANPYPMLSKTCVT